MIPRMLVGLAVVVVLVLPILFDVAQVAAEEEGAKDAPVDASTRAIQAWGKTCNKCHAVPDKAFETDRAFLRQIMDTT